jgi:hypothetical protein
MGPQGASAGRGEEPAAGGLAWTQVHVISRRPGRWPIAGRTRSALGEGRAVVVLLNRAGVTGGWQALVCVQTFDYCARGQGSCFFAHAAAYDIPYSLDRGLYTIGTWLAPRIPAAACPCAL